MVVSMTMTNMNGRKVYQPLHRPARVDGLPLIQRSELDVLGDELLRHPLDPTVEEVFAIARHQYSWSTMLIPLPNMADDPKNDFVIYAKDAEWLSEKDFDLLGYVHTHRAGNDRQEPSQHDLEGLGFGYIGGVWMHGGDTVYWYGKGQVFHTTSVLRSALTRTNRGSK